MLRGAYIAEEHKCWSSISIKVSKKVRRWGSLPSSQPMLRKIKLRTNTLTETKIVVNAMSVTVTLTAFAVELDI